MIFRSPPRIDQSVEIDGKLDEAVWSQAAVLAGFSRYAPVDGAPADNPTDVLVWYSPSAIHFGIRATAPAGSVRATLADRDRIQSDDHVIIFLSTYNDGRQAMVFGVNPLGVHFSRIRVSDLLLVNARGETVVGQRPLNKAAFAIHAAIHERHPGVVAAAHTHSTFGKAFSTLGQPLAALTQDS